MHALQDRYRRLLAWARGHVQAVVFGCDRPARGRAHRPPDARERVPAQARRGQHLAHAHAAARVLAREHQAGRARACARSCAPTPRSGRSSRRWAGPTTAPTRSGRTTWRSSPTCSRAGPGGSRPRRPSSPTWRRKVRTLPGRLDQLLAGDPGQRRGSALGREGRDRREGRRARPRHPRGQGRPDRVDPEGGSAARPTSRRSGSAARARSASRSTAAKLARYGISIARRERGDPDRARRERRERVLRGRPALRRHAPGRHAVPRRGRRHREPAGVAPGRRRGEPAAGRLALDQPRRPRDGRDPAGRGADQPRGGQPVRGGEGEPDRPRPGVVRRGSDAARDARGRGAGRLPDHLGRPVREPAARARAPADHHPDLAARDLHAALLGVRLAPQVARSCSRWCRSR